MAALQQLTDSRRATHASSRPDDTIEGFLMAIDQGRVIVAIGATANSTSVHHRDFPEIRSDGATPAEAAAHLANQLTRALDSALTQWRRETIGQAIADIQAFVAQNPS
jgi:hypothetical protein